MMDICLAQKLCPPGSLHCLCGHQLLELKHTINIITRLRNPPCRQNKIPRVLSGYSSMESSTARQLWMLLMGISAEIRKIMMSFGGSMADLVLTDKSRSFNSTESLETLWHLLRFCTQTSLHQHLDNSIKR